MKRRVYKVLNFFAFNLLFFALYLNFIHKDKNVQEAIQAAQGQANQETVIVENTGQYLQKPTAQHSPKQKAVQAKESDIQIVSIN